MEATVIIESDNDGACSSSADMDGSARHVMSPASARISRCRLWQRLLTDQPRL